MEYVYDSLIFTWNIKTYYTCFNGMCRLYWLAESVVISTPYYEEVGWVSSDYWDTYYYDAGGNCMGNSPSYAQNINNLIENMTGTFSKDNYLIKEKMYEDIPRWSYEILDKSNITSSVGYSDLLGSLLFSVIKKIAMNLFLGYVPPPYEAFLLFLNLLDYTDTTFSGSALIQCLEWQRLGESQNVWVRVYKTTKQESYLSNYYDQISSRPLVIKYLVEIRTSPRGGEPVE